MRIALLVLAFAAVPPAIAAPLPADILARELKGLVAGPPQSCVRLPRLEGPTIVDDHTLIYRQGSTRYVNTIAGGCAGLRPGLAVTSRTPSPNLCEGDIVRVFDPFARVDRGSCGLGTFTPWRKPRSPAR